MADAGAISLGAWIILAGQVVSFVGIVLSVYLGVNNRREVNNLTISVNGRLNELLETSKVAATAHGRAEGRAEEAAAQMRRAERNGL